MDQEELERRRIDRRRRARIRKQKARRRFFFIVLVLLILLLTLIFRKKPNKKINMENTSSDYVTTLLRINMREDKLNPMQFNIKKDNVKALSYIAEVRASRMKKKIVPKNNHITAVSRYAYDTKWVRDITSSKKTYEGDKKIAFLTFDDGPNTKITPQVIKILRDNNARGTFFVVGRAINEHSKEYLKEALYSGNAIAMHSYTHDYHLLYPERVADTLQIEREAKLLMEKLKKNLGDDFESHVWRYPGGHMSWQGLESADQTLSGLGINWIDWNSLSGDAEPKAVRPSTSEGFVKYIDRSLNENKENKIAVVLMHDALNKQHTADALPQIINYFRDRGYEFGILK